MRDETASQARLAAGRLCALALLLGLGGFVVIGRADEPTTAYIFPAGGQRGQTVGVKVGGTFLHGTAHFEMLGQGVAAKPTVSETETVWFEGPPLLPPESSRKEDYPRDHAGEIAIAADALLGQRLWRVWTSQGVADHRTFVVGDLPELVEQEIDGAPLPTEVALPVTINGRIFPREDIDLWTFAAKAGDEVTLEIVAQRIGSPLAARLEVVDAQGKLLAETTDRHGADPRLRFRAPADGQYTVRVFDASYDGLQQMVYRLTIAGGAYVDRVYPLGARRGSEATFELAGQRLAGDAAATQLKLQIPADAPRIMPLALPAGMQRALPYELDIDDLPEHLEVGDNDQPSPAAPLAVPAVLNGRIERPGDADHWAIAVKKGVTYDVEVRAARLGSRLDATLAVLDAAGKVLSANDDAAGGLPDSRLSLATAEDGVWVLRVADRFRGRGGDDFAYRLRVTEAAAQPDFRLSVADDVVTVFRDLPAETIAALPKNRPQPRRLKQPTLRVDAARLGGFQEEIDLVVEPLPPGVTISGNKIGKGAPNATIRFHAAPQTKIDVARLKVRGTAKIGEQVVARDADIATPAGRPAVDHVLLAVAIETPFTIESEYAVAFASAGSTHLKGYSIQRNGYTGPLTVRIADRQMRHLQGVTGPTISLPLEATSFTYPVTLPPWMTLGRTSRSVVMVLGQVKDHDGSEHTVSFFNDTQNYQLVCVLKPSEINVTADREIVTPQPGGTVDIRVEVQRTKAFAAAPVRVGLVLPSHFQGISADPIVIPPGAHQGTLTLRFASELGPCNMPALIRATTEQIAPAQAEPAQSAEVKIEFAPTR